MVDPRDQIQDYQIKYKMNTDDRVNSFVYQSHVSSGHKFCIECGAKHSGVLTNFCLPNNFAYYKSIVGLDWWKRVKF